MMGRAIVLVNEDQLSLAIGRRGQNVRLGSKLCKWDIEIMTREELEEQIERAVGGFSALDGVEDDLAEMLVGEGFLSYDDLSVIEPSDLMEMGGITEEQVDKIVEQAEAKAEEAEQAAAAERRRRREEERIAKATEEAEALEKAKEEAAEKAAAEAAAAAGESPAEEAATEESPAEEAATEEAATEASPAENETNSESSGGDATESAEVATDDSAAAADS